MGPWGPPAGRRALFFGATRQAEGVELRRFHEALRRDLGDQVADLAGRFENWERVLRFAAALRKKLEHVPGPVADPLLAVWGRAGASPAVRKAGVLGFSARDVVS